MTTDRAARIAEIAERHEKATPGEWLPAQDGEHRYASIKGEERPGHKGDGSHRTMPPPGVRFTGENADFIAHAHQDIPYLISALSTADAERREMVELMREAAGVAHDNSMGGALGSWFCERCGAITKQKSWPHFDQFEHGPDCLVTKLIQAADRADGGRG